MNARRIVLAAGLAYGIWETVDIFWISVPAAAAVFAALFLGCTVWFWRRNSHRAVAALLALCAYEAGVVPTLHAETITKFCDAGLGVVGVLAASAVLARRLRVNRAAAASPGPGGGRGGQPA